MIEADLAGFLNIGRRARFERIGFKLYNNAVAAGRDPYLYAELGVPDTLDGRFDIIGLHVFLLINRLKRDVEPGPALAQAVFDAMFLDMDINLREMGVGDMSVGKRNRAMWEAFHGRSAAYAAAWDNNQALEQALARNIWRGVAPPAASAEALQRLARVQDKLLAEQDLATLQTDGARFLAAAQAASLPSPADANTVPNVVQANSFQPAPQVGQ